MMSRSKEVIFAAAIVVLMLIGLAYGELIGSLPRSRLPATISLSGKSFASRAVYCPPSVTQTHDTTRIALTPVGEAGVPVSVEAAATPSPEPQPSLGGAGDQAGASPSPPGGSVTPNPQQSPKRPEEVPSGHARFASSGSDRAMNVVGYAGAVVASAVTMGSSGSGAAGCSSVAGTHWYFAEGSSDLGYDERLILYNPFPDEAVVRVSFITAKGKESKANLSDQAVPSGATSMLRVNSFVLREPLLSIEVDAVRGRVVAWRSLQSNAAKQPHGEEFSLGATSSHTDWFFPAGEIGSGYDERIALLNPNDKAARVSISVLTDKGTVQPAKLLDITVPPASSTTVAPAGAMKSCVSKGCAIGTVVSSTNGIGVVAERTISYSTDQIRGVASETGAWRTSPRWYLGPGSFDPTRDSVFVLNPTTANARVSLKLVSDNRGPRAPAALQHLKIRAGTRAEISLQRWTSGEPVVVLLSSDQQVVAERFSYSRSAHDVAALMGRPLPE